MIETLARKRTHLAALVVLAALAVALFAVLQAASGQTGKTIKLSLQGSVTINGTTLTYTESDNVVKAGTNYTILGQKGEEGDAPTWDANTSYVSGDSGLIVSAATDTPTVTASDAAAGGNVGNVIIPNGLSDGDYTIFVKVADHYGELEVTVGDPGEPIGSAEVVLGTVNTTTGNFGTGEGTGKDKATKGKGSNIAVTVNVLNSLGEKPPNSVEVSGIHLFAPLANVIRVDPSDGSAASSSGDTASNSNSYAEAANNTDTVAASANFFVRSSTAQSVDVYAIVIGTGGSATSAPLTLSWTGDATTLVLGDPSSPISTTYLAAREASQDPPVVEAREESGHATIEVTATDDAGNDATLTATTYTDDNRDTPTSGQDPAPNISDASVKIVDADDEPASKLSSQVDQKMKDGEAVTTAVVVKIWANDDSVEPGEYTVKVNLADKDPVTTTVVVAGPAKNVELTTEQAEGSSIVTVTATVTDEGGNLVPDAGTVDFINAGSLSITALDDDDNNAMNGAQRTLDDGVASVRYVIIGDSGTATIIVSAAAGVDAVTTISVDGAEAEEVEEISAANCLSTLSSGPSVWTCEGGGTASEIFPTLNSRGATALWLWNGSSWQRYSVRDGNMIPGSTDFMIQHLDSLWISY